jgi:hypothetical protein
MKITQLPELAEYYMNQIRKRVDKVRPGIHLSDMDLCPDKVFYRQTLEDAPSLPDQSCLFFMSGLCIEDWLVPIKQEPVEKDGILCSVDDITPYGVSEIKSTRKGLNNFDPKTSYPWWVFRCKGYCYALGITEINLVVFFWVGNRSEIPIALRAWRLSFEQAELDEHWKEVLRRKAILDEALRSGEPPKETWVQPWECNACEMTVVCARYKERIMKE